MYISNIYRCKKWSVALAVVAIITSLILMFGVLTVVSTWSRNASNDLNNLKKWQSASYDALSEAESMFRSSKSSFYTQKTPCKSYENIRTNTAKINERTVSQIRPEDMQSVSDNNSEINSKFPDQNWWIDRVCTVYSKSIPNSIDADYSLYKMWNLVLSDIGRLDDNNFYNIWTIQDNSSIPFVFTKDSIGWKPSVTIRLDYWFQWLPDVNVYGQDLSNMSLLLKKEWKDFNKENIFSYIKSDARWPLQLSLVSFIGSFNASTWHFEVDPSTWQVESGIAIINGVTVDGWINKAQRLFCDKSNIVDISTCSISAISVDPSRVYFWAIKSYDQTVRYHFDLLDSSNSNLPVITDRLYVSWKWMSRWILSPFAYSTSLDNLGWGFISWLSSAIFDYVFFSAQ